MWPLIGKRSGARPPGTAATARATLLALVALLPSQWTATAAYATESSGDGAPSSEARLLFDASVSADGGGADLHVYAHGTDRTNPVVVMINGGPCSPLWGVANEFLAPLTDEFTLAYFDTRSVGASTGEAPESWQTHVGDVLAVARAMRTTFAQTDVMLWGWSAGSLLALNASTQAEAGLVRGVVVTSLKVDAQRGFPYRYQAVEQVYGVPPWLTSSLPLLLQRALFFSAPHLYACNSQPRDVLGCADVATRLVTGVADTRGVAGAMRSAAQAEWCRIQLGDEWNDIRMSTIRGTVPAPLYVLLGRHDRMDPSEFATPEALAPLAPPELHFRWFEASAHVPFAEQTDEYVAVTRAALRAMRDRA